LSSEYVYKIKGSNDLDLAEDELGERLKYDIGIKIIFAFRQSKLYVYFRED